MNMKKITNILGILLLAVLLNGCTKDFLDINKSPNSPTTPELNQLLSGSQYFMVQALSQGNFIGYGLESYVHQLVSRETQNYSMTGQANNPYNTWNYLYTYVLNDYDAIVENAEADGNLIYAGIAKTLKAYAFSMMVDLWGDIPYSEFNVPGNIAPKPDSSKDIYNSLIALLESGKADLENTSAANGIKPGTDDFFYGGNAAKWVRLNNSIKLKLLLQSRKAKSDITDWQTKLNALIADNKFIASGEDFQFWYNAGTTPQDMRHPAINSYTGQTTHYISPYFYETMRGQTYNTVDNPFAGINDPRVPYYFYRQKNNTAATESPYEYRNGGFISIFFATNGPNANADNRNSTTKLGIYLCGGKYDDGSASASPIIDGYGVAPHKMLTYSILKFMLAELALTGEISGDAKTYLKEAMDAAVAHVNTVATKQKDVPTITNEKRDEFVNAVLAKFDAANAEGKMRIVMTQKWIANVFNPLDIYTDYRRTGFPLWFDPAKTQNPGFGVNPTVAEKSPAAVPLLNFATYPRSFYYPTNSETELNTNMPQKTDITVPFVFWDKK